jgi:hypothetical protein
MGRMKETLEEAYEGYDEKYDPVSKPIHYVQGRSYEPAKVIQDWDLNFFLGNVVKYVSRAGRKESASRKEDLSKALWYLQQEINHAHE